MFRLNRREIIEGLIRQGVYGLSRIKSECRRFEHYWEERMVDMAC
ncbi:MAG: hypothetical protein ACLQDF_06425 [Desulfomonilia bacterium]